MVNKLSQLYFYMKNFEMTWKCLKTFLKKKKEKKKVGHPPSGPLWQTTAGISEKVSWQLHPSL